MMVDVLSHLIASQNPSSLCKHHSSVVQFDWKAPDERQMVKARLWQSRDEEVKENVVAINPSFFFLFFLLIC